MNDPMCFVCNPVKLRVHTGNDQWQPEGTMLTKKPQTVSPSAERSHSDFTQAPLSIPTLWLQPHLAPSNSHTYHIHSGPPHPPRDGNSYACVRKVDILLLKNPPSGRIQYLLLLGQPSLLVFRIFTVSPKRSSQHWHTVTQPLTDSQAILMGEGRASFRRDCVSHKTEEWNQSFVMVYADAPRSISDGTRIKKLKGPILYQFSYLYFSFYTPVEHLEWLLSKKMYISPENSMCSPLFTDSHKNKTKQKNAGF